MRIFASFSPVIKILLWTIFAVSTVCLIVGILAACSVLKILEISPASGLVLISSMPLPMLMTASVATIHYKLNDTHLHLNIAFWDILGGRIAVANILNIVYSENKMYISYIWKGYDPVIALISISPKKFDKLKNALMAKNKNIVFYNNDKNESSYSE